MTTAWVLPLLPVAAATPRSSLPTRPARHLAVALRRAGLGGARPRRVGGGSRGCDGRRHPVSRMDADAGSRCCCRDRRTRRAVQGGTHPGVARSRGRSRTGASGGCARGNDLRRCRRSRRSVPARSCVVTDRSSDDWPIVDVLDRRNEDPTKSGPFAADLRRHIDGDRRVVCVLNRTGRARLLACAACGELVRSDDGGQIMRLVDDELVSADGSERRPVICTVCGSTALKTLRMGVERAGRNSRPSLVNRSTRSRRHRSNAPSNGWRSAQRPCCTVLIGLMWSCSSISIRSCWPCASAPPSRRWR